MIFSFRVWVLADDPPEIEVWYHGIEPMEPTTRFISDWAREALENLDFWDAFKLEKGKSWQVVGRASVTVVTILDEYDETLECLDFEKEEIPPDFVRLLVER